MAVSLYLEDKDSNTYNFNASFGLIGRQFKMREKIERRAFSHGAVDLGDGKIDYRVLTMKGHVWGDTAAEYRTAIQNLYEFLQRQGLKLYYSSSWYANVERVRSVSHSFLEGSMERAASVEVQLQAADPFFYSTTKTTQNETVSASPKSFTVNNTGSVDVYPVITITNTADNPTLAIKNITDDNAELTYVDGAFQNGNVLVVDCQAGTVKKDSANSIRWFGGSFLRLLTGNNNMEYTGANCTLKIEFYPREL